MFRSRTASAQESFAPAMAFVLCALAAIPLLAKHDDAHPTPGARNAFQLLSSKPDREISIAIRSQILVVTVPEQQA